MEFDVQQLADDVVYAEQGNKEDHNESVNELFSIISDQGKTIKECVDMINEIIDDPSLSRNAFVTMEEIRHKLNKVADSSDDDGKEYYLWLLTNCKNNVR